jgi:hypothetical protein
MYIDPIEESHKYIIGYTVPPYHRTCLRALKEAMTEQLTTSGPEGRHLGPELVRIRGTAAIT